MLGSIFPTLCSSCERTLDVLDIVSLKCEGREKWLGSSVSGRMGTA